MPTSHSLIRQHIRDRADAIECRVNINSHRGRTTFNASVVPVCQGLAEVVTGVIPKLRNGQTCAAAPASIVVAGETLTFRSGTPRTCDKHAVGSHGFEANHRTWVAPTPGLPVGTDVVERPAKGHPWKVQSVHEV